MQISLKNSQCEASRNEFVRSLIQHICDTKKEFMQTGTSISYPTLPDMWRNYKRILEINEVDIKFKLWGTVNEEDDEEDIVNHFKYSINIGKDAPWWFHRDTLVCITGRLYTAEEVEDSVISKKNRKNQRMGKVSLRDAIDKTYDTLARLKQESQYADLK